MRPAATSSSATTGTSGINRARALRIIASAAVSAAVTGEESALVATAKSCWKMVQIAAPASRAASTKPSSKAARKTGLFSSLMGASLAA